MATIEKRKTSQGTVYRVKVRRRGHRSESATFERLTDARNWARSTEAAVQEGRYFRTSEAKRHTLEEAIDRYLRDRLPLKRPSTRKGQRAQLEWWKAKLGDYTLADLTPAVIAQARDDLAATPAKRGKRETPRSPASVTRYLAVLSHLCTIAVKEWGWMQENPAQKITRPQEPRGRVRFLNNAERAALLAACRESGNELLYDVVLLALSTGMRKGEILGLTWDAVDFQRRTITLEETKNGERRVVPIVGPVYGALTERSRIRRIDSPYVFPAPRRYGKAPQPIDITSAWRVAVKRANLKDFRFHDLRHSAASELAMSGATLPEIAVVLGHKTLAMVQRYAHFCPDHVSGVVERMTDKVFGDGTQKGTGS